MTTTTADTTNGKAGTTEAPPDIRGFSIPRPENRHMTVHIVSLSSLIMHKWSEKAIRALEDSQTGKPKAQKTAKVPMEEALSAAYILPGKEKAPDGPGKFYFPAPAFKHAFLYGVSQLDDVKKFPKTKTTGWVFVNTDPVLDFKQVEMRTDVTRNPTQMTYRLEFFEWSAALDITYNALTIQPEQVAALFDLGGTGGVGEWRPTSPKNKSGDHGRFYVAGIETEKRS